MDVVRLARVEAILLFAAMCFMCRRWRSLLRPDTRTSSESGQVDTLEQYLAASIRQLAMWFLATCTFWLAFYALLSFSPDHPSGLFDFLCDLVTNAGTWCLVGFYLSLSLGERPRRTSGQMGAILVGCAFLVVSVMVYEFLLSSQNLVPPEDPVVSTAVFKVIYGFGQALGLFLVTGRLESASIHDHILTNFSQARGHLYRWGVFFGYLYAAIQPLYPFLLESDSTIGAGLVGLAFVLKAILIGWVDLLLAPARNPSVLSPMQHYIYESERFALEESSSFERAFLAEHFRSLYLKKHKERGIGFLGVDYDYLNDFKRRRLHLEDWTVGGILVRDVHPGTDAMTKGIRRGDYITKIDGVPLGRKNQLSQLLEGVDSKGDVEVTLVRKKVASDQVTGKDKYQELNLTVSLSNYEKLIRPKVPKEAMATLDCEFRHNSPDHGVVCRWRKGNSTTDVTITGMKSHLLDRYFETPDVRMLRAALAQLVPGETVALEGTSTNAEGTDHWHRHVLMKCQRPLRREGVSQHSKSVTAEVRAVAKDDRDAILKAHPDKFAGLGQGGQPVSLDAMNHKLETAKNCVAFVFDAKFSRLFDYHCGDGHAMSTIRQLPVWSHVDSGPIHVFIGRFSGPSGTRTLVEEGFVTFDHDRIAFGS
jgi:hypothetical protein